MSSDRAEAYVDVEENCPEIVSEYEFELALSSGEFYRDLLSGDMDDLVDLVCVRLDNSGAVMPFWVGDVSALNWYSYKNRYDVVEILLNWIIAVPQESDLNRATPLHWATLGNSYETASLLLERGAEVDARDLGGMTPLHYSTCYPSYEVTLLLLQNGADIEARTTLAANNNKGGMAPLHYAAFCNNFQVVKLLLDRGADVDALDRNGLTPAEWARIGEASFELVRLLEPSN